MWFFLKFLSSYSVATVAIKLIAIKFLVKFYPIKIKIDQMVFFKLFKEKFPRGNRRTFKSFFGIKEETFTKLYKKISIHTKPEVLLYMMAFFKIYASIDVLHSIFQVSYLIEDLYKNLDEYILKIERILHHTIFRVINFLIL